MNRAPHAFTLLSFLQAGSMMVEGVGNTPAAGLLRVLMAPRSVLLVDQPLQTFEYAAESRLLWIRFPNEAGPRPLAIEF